MRTARVLGGAVLLAGVLTVGPAGAAVEPPAGCPAGGAALAGYGTSAVASGSTYQLNSPGLLPFGDANVGTVFESDEAFARTLLSPGPDVDSLASPLYPGDAAAHLGTALATTGFPPGIIPNYPVLAESTFPPAPATPGSASFSSPAGGVGAATASSHASTDGGDALGAVTGVTAPAGPGSGFDPTAPVQSASLQATAKTDVTASCVDAVAESDTGTLKIAGVITVAGVQGRATATATGAGAKPDASLEIGKVTVAGVSASIDQAGIHLGPAPAIGGGVVESAAAQLQAALAADGVQSIRLVQPRATSKGGQATADSGGLVITMKQTVPQLGSPPNGTPPIPLQTVITYGEAQVTVAATTAGASPPLTTSPGATATGLGQPAQDTSTGAGIPTGPSGPTFTSPAQGPSSTVTPAPGGGSLYTARPIVAQPPGRGSPVPVGWILLGLFACLVVTGPMLGYARWQLLEGRI